jgi:hypothetical protein
VAGLPNITAAAALRSLHGRPLSELEKMMLGQSSGWSAMAGRPAAGRGIAGGREDGRWQGEVLPAAGRWPAAERVTGGQLWE